MDSEGWWLLSGVHSSVFTMQSFSYLMDVLRQKEFLSRIAIRTPNLQCHNQEFLTFLLNEYKQ